MLRKWILIFGLVLSLSFVWAQGSEDFANSTATASYGSGSFVGNNGITWTYVASRDENGDDNNSGIAIPALMLRRVADNSAVASSTIGGGIGDFSVKLYKGFTGGGNRQVELFINGVSKGTSTPFDDFDEHIFAVTGINIAGDITIEIKNITSKQVIVDDITWTGYGAGGNLLPSITNITQTPSTDITSSTSVSVSADVTDTDGTITSVLLKWGTETGLYPNTINMSATGITYTTVTDIPAQANGSTVFYVIQATDNEAGFTTSSEITYSVYDPGSLPYTHDFADGWGDIYTYSVAGDTKEWYLYGNSASINGYGSTLEEDWMILPAINFDNYSNEIMNFNTLGTYGVVDANNYLKLYWSSNHLGAGDPSTATWTQIPFTLADIGAGLTPSGNVDLSGITGSSVHLAFKYHSTDNPTRWEVSDINIYPAGAGTPIITTLPTSLSGLDYVIGEGPSAIQSFTISGANLSADLILTPETNFHISIMDGASFIALNPITLSPVGGNLPETTIYVRLKAGLPAASYNEQITISSTGADNSTVALSGAVTGPQPTVAILQRPAQIDISDASYQSAVMVKLENYPTDDVRYRLYNGGTQYNPWDAATDTWVSSFSYSAGPAVPGTATTSTTWWIPFEIGSNLTTVANYRDRLGPAYASPNFQTQALPPATAITTPAVIMDTQVNFTTWNDYTQKYIVLAYNATTAGDLIAAASTDLDTGAFSVRVEDGTTISRIEIRDVMNNLIESVTGTWPIALNSEIIVTGTVDPLANIAGMPSDEIGSYHLSGIDLYADIELVAPEHFEIATAETGPWSSSLSLDASFDANVYVRINSAVVGQHAGDITHNSAGATQVNVRVEGETFPTTGTIIVTQTLVPFSQDLGTPSAAQSYTLQGSDLSGPIAVTAGSPFELSANGTTGWAASLDFAENYNGLVYVRMNAAAAGTYEATILHENANTTAVSFMVSGTATPSAGELENLFFSEYIEGSSNNKAIEIYNAEGSPVDLANYKVKLASNGNPWGNTLNLSGILPAGGVYVIANSSAMQAILDLADVTSNVTYYNGDDALGLFYGELLIDVIGIPEESPYVKWDVAGVTDATENHTLIRKATVTQGNTDWASSAGTNADNSEWIVMDMDYIADLGTHTYGAGIPIPIVTINEAAGQITLSWDAVSGATQYKVYSDDDPYGDFSVMEVITPNITVTLPANSKKFYRVVATDNPPPAK
ncbi:MAG: lamin tail domain-containing protein [Candidatus Cloacimonadaceae bacterium]|jgi:hypothetical protein|nr:lamin tail domain-containing protein [Candidatus Cloacimonadota bacterium]MCB5255040.1 lamin tail domain-containing protein [Candidatus Cloacimonadota bacterium]MCK9243183.1 lamin tail domain-containing protein [Candidatus Cloacimonadota bacterium]MDY0128019.1 lamin tail domain-containing protein [Candidatus Cloacimonadaceae bacterium]